MQTVTVMLNGQHISTMMFEDDEVSEPDAMLEALAVLDPFQNEQAWKEEEQNWN